MRRDSSAKTLGEICPGRGSHWSRDHELGRSVALTRSERKLVMPKRMRMLIHMRAERRKGVF